MCSVAPLIGPTIGAGLRAIGPWRLIYAALALVGATLGAVALTLFPESHDAKMRRSVRPATLIAGDRRAIINPMCGGFSLVVGLVFAGLFAYVNVSPLLFIDGYGVSKVGFGGLLAMTASGVIAGSLLNTWLVRTHARPRAVFDAALGVISLAATTVLAASLNGPPSLVFVIAPATIFMSAFGLVVPNAVHEAIHPLPEIAGVASTVLTSGQMLCGATGASLGASLAAGALYALWLRPFIEE